MSIGKNRWLDKSRKIKIRDKQWGVKKTHPVRKWESSSIPDGSDKSLSPATMLVWCYIDRYYCYISYLLNACIHILVIPVLIYPSYIQ